MEREEPTSAVSTIIELVKKKLPAHYGVPPSDIQVLTPMQRGEVGANNLNLALQEAVNPAGSPDGGSSLHRGGYTYRARDKIMQIRNNYDKEVFNGDIGTVTEINLEDRELTASFEGLSVVYDVTELDEVVLAYATTIQKSQGSGCRNRYRTDADWHASSPSRCSGPTGDLQNRRSYSRRRPYPSASCRWGESTVFGKLNIEEARLTAGFSCPNSVLAVSAFLSPCYAFVHGFL